jgi:hypothetical protein
MRRKATPSIAKCWKAKVIATNIEFDQLLASVRFTPEKIRRDATITSDTALAHMKGT